MKSPRVLLLHILNSINQIEQYIFGLKKEEFLINFLVRDAVIRNLEIIGEASKNIAEEFKKNNPSVPWRDIVSMRNKVIHEYFLIDEETVWNVITQDIPRIKNESS